MHFLAFVEAEAACCGCRARLQLQCFCRARARQLTIATERVVAGPFHFPAYVNAIGRYATGRTYLGVAHVGLELLGEEATQFFDGGPSVEGPGGR